MPPRSPLVTYYHSVAPVPFANWPLGFLTMRMERFEEELDHIVERGWRTVFLEEWWRIRNGEDRSRGDELVITFDDGLLDNWVFAFPLLKKRGLKATFFICPELIESGDHLRPNLDDMWSGRARLEDLPGPGYLSWGECRALQHSGLVDVQSHTMTHTKHIVSDRLRGVDHGGFEGFYLALNACPPAMRPRWAQDPEFGTRVPIGMPLFEENSAVIARRVSIRPAFLEAAGKLAGEHDLSRAEGRAAHEAALRALHGSFLANDGVLEGEESFDEHVARVEHEIIGSKHAIERELDKPVRFLCWPHGGNSPAVHAVAKQAGYVATTAGKLTALSGDPDRIPRTGTGWPLGPRMRRLKFDAKMGAAHGQQPYRALAGINALKHRLSGKG